MPPNVLCSRITQDAAGGDPRPPGPVPLQLRCPKGRHPEAVSRSVGQQGHRGVPLLQPDEQLREAQGRTDPHEARARHGQRQREQPFAALRLREEPAGTGDPWFCSPRCAEDALINDLGKRYRIREIAIDRWNATQITTQLMGDGFEMIGFGQGFASMSARSCSW